MSANQRMDVPRRFTESIESWLQGLTTTTYSFRPSPVTDPVVKPTVYIGDVHADPRGLITALFISGLINSSGDWRGGNERVVLMGDVLDGVERNGTNPSVTQWDELLCLRILCTIKEDSQRHGGDLIWVLGNHDIAAVFGQDAYLHPVQARGYLPRKRQEWFSPGTGILAFYMARCGIIAGTIGNTLVSHAGLCVRHIQNSAIAPGTNGMTAKMRRLLLTGTTTKEELDSWYSMDGVMMHRVYDIKPFASIPIEVMKKLDAVTELTGTDVQLIGHNYRQGIQKIMTKKTVLLLTDTGISRSFGPKAKVECLRIHQAQQTMEAYSVQ